eukprot:9489258-Pyramimonas_sp.AAC.5
MVGGHAGRGSAEFRNFNHGGADVRVHQHAIPKLSRPERATAVAEPEPGHAVHDLVAVQPDDLAAPRVRVPPVDDRQRRDVAPVDASPLQCPLQLRTPSTPQPRVIILHPDRHSSILTPQTESNLSQMSDMWHSGIQGPGITSAHDCAIAPAAQRSRSGARDRETRACLNAQPETS